jgi:hypothetical protein
VLSTGKERAREKKRNKPLGYGQFGEAFSNYGQFSEHVIVKINGFHFINKNIK